MDLKSAEVVNALRVFDLCYDPYVVSAVEIEEISDGDNIVCGANEGRGNEINVKLDTELKIVLVALAEEGNIQVNVGDVDSLSVCELAACDDLAYDLAFAYFGYAKLDLAVVYENFLSYADLLRELVVGDAYLFVAAGAIFIGAERERLTFNESG